MTLVFCFLRRFTQCQADKDRPKYATVRARWKADHAHRFLSCLKNRASSIRADTNKENIPSSSASSSSSVGEDTSSSFDTQGGHSGHAERTPKARKSKHSPTLVQLTDNQDASAVSHHAFSPRLFFFLNLCHHLGSVSPTFLMVIVCFLTAFFLFCLSFLTQSQVSRRCRSVDNSKKATFFQFFVALSRLLKGTAFYQQSTGLLSQTAATHIFSSNASVMVV